MKNISKGLKRILIVAFWLLVWQVAAMMVGNALLLPSPVETVRALARLCVETQFYEDVGATVLRTVVAIALAFVSGLLLALASYKWNWLKELLSLPVAFFKAVPVMAIAIYVLLLLSSGKVPVLVCWVMCFPIVYTNILTGLENLSAEILEMAQMYQIEGRRKLRYIIVPALYPFFSSAMSIVAGMSWKAIVTAEVLSVPKFSLGYELMNSKYYLNTDALFAYVGVIILVSLIFEKLIKLAMDKLAPRSYEGSRVMKLSSIGLAGPKLGRAEGLPADASNETSSLCTAVNCDEPLDCPHTCNLETSAATVELRDVDMSYGEKKVLDGFDMRIDAGELVSLMAPSGAGKTTIARLICGLEKAQAGEVLLSTSSKNNAEASSANKERISMLFQEDRLLPWLNVYDNLAVVLRECTESGRAACTAAADAKIRRSLAAVGLGSEMWKLPGELSGGMNRRLAIARAFVFDSGLLIADEPFRGLDAETRESVIENLWRPGVLGRSVLLITHSQEDAEELTSRKLSL